MAMAFWPALVAAQERLLLSPLDSAQLRVAVIRTVLDRASWTASTRLWVRPPRRYDREAKQQVELQFTPDEWSAIQREFPAAVLAPWEEDLFLCPPGRQVQMPGSGCPIREDGLILSFGGITLEEDGRVRAGGSLIQSRDAMTWLQSLDMVFARSGTGEWKFAEILSVSIT